jgi:Na+-translocating ferredoxin:NAD+ oxidoreductase RnfG subunit
VRVYFTEHEALAKVFGKADRGARHTWTPTDEQRGDLEQQLGVAVSEESFAAWRGRDGDKDLGWALVLEEKGRFKPITFLVHVEPDHTVGLVLVMVYRESRGDGVKRQRFLKQFRGRDADDPLRLNRDVVGVTGATLSSRALAAGVRRALVLTDARYGGLP